MKPRNNKGEKSLSLALLCFILIFLLACYIVRNLCIIDFLIIEVFQDMNTINFFRNSLRDNNMLLLSIILVFWLLPNMYVY